MYEIRTNKVIITACMSMYVQFYSDILRQNEMYDYLGKNHTWSNLTSKKMCIDDENIFKNRKTLPSRKNLPR